MMSLAGLQKKVGPLPAWGWGVVLGGLILGVMFWNKSKGDAGGGIVASPLPIEDAFKTRKQDAVAGAGGSSGGALGDLGVPGAGTVFGPTPDPSNNNSWMTQLQNDLNSRGNTPDQSYAQSIDYLSQQMTAMSSSISDALTRIGTPPEDVGLSRVASVASTNPLTSIVPTKPRIVSNQTMAQRTADDLAAMQRGEARVVSGATLAKRRADELASMTQTRTSAPTPAPTSRVVYVPPAPVQTRSEARVVSGATMAARTQSDLAAIRSGEARVVSGATLAKRRAEEAAAMKRKK